MAVWVSLDACEESVAEPEVGVWLQSHETDEPWQHPYVTAGRNDRALIEV